MTESNDVEFSALIGEHELSGVDFETIPPDPTNWRDAANAMRFVLDGKIYVVTEDPSDGYRSSMDSLRLVDGPPVANTFGPVRVVGRLKTRGEYTSCDILEFIDVTNGEVVMELGTDNDDDYYPSYVANFNPEKMAINAEVKP